MMTSLFLPLLRYAHTHTHTHRNTPTHPHKHTHTHTQTHTHTHTNTHTQAFGCGLQTRAEILELLHQYLPNEELNEYHIKMASVPQVWALASCVS
jgi:hypothetical protein